MVDGETKERYTSVMLELLGKLVLDNATSSFHKVIAVDFNGTHERVLLEHEGWRNIDEVTPLPKDPKQNTEL